MELIDTHCHFQFADYPFAAEEVLERARHAGVSQVVAVGCRLEDSQAAVAAAAAHQGVSASIGLHPHEADHYVHDTHALQQFHGLASHPEVVAIGETGLDYHYNHSSRPNQAQLFRLQLDIAAEHNLPLIFHVREAFDDFFSIIDHYNGVRGIVHSFSAGRKELEGILERGLYVGFNGIMTFSRDPEQLAAARTVPLEKMVLETDAPFLTPAPFRGKVNEPSFVRRVAEFLSDLRNESLDSLAAATTRNAREILRI